MSIISAGTSNTTSIVYTGDTTGNLVFQSNGTTEAMRITNAQLVGIGTATPGCALDTAGLIRASSLTNPSSGYGIEMGYDGTEGVIQVFNNRATNTPAALFLGASNIKLPVSGSSILNKIGRAHV